MDWSIGFKKGKKTPVEISKQMVSRWGFMVSNSLYKPNFIIDTAKSKVIIFG
jgi:hypothetical protein